MHLKDIAYNVDTPGSELRKSPFSGRKRCSYGAPSLLLSAFGAGRVSSMLDVPGASLVLVPRPRTSSAMLSTKSKTAECAANAAALLLSDLPTDVITLIAAALGDTLEPWHLSRLSTTSRGMQLALAPFTSHFRVEHEASTSLLERIGMPWKAVRREKPTEFDALKKLLTPADAPILCRLLQSNAFGRITQLALIDSALGDQAVDAVCGAAAGGGLANLTRLYLNANGLTTAGSSTLSRCLHQGYLRRLKGLFMHQNPLGDAGVSAVADAIKHGALPELERLGLVAVGLGPAGMKSLMAAAEAGPLTWTL